MMENLGEKSEEKEVLVGFFLGGKVENFVVGPMCFLLEPTKGRGKLMKMS